MIHVYADTMPGPTAEEKLQQGCDALAALIRIAPTIEFSITKECLS